MTRPKLKIAILSTDTLHHRYFLKQLWRQTSDHAHIALNLFETKPYPWRWKAWRHFLGNLPNLWKGSAENPYLQPNLGPRIDSYEKPRFFPDGDMDLPVEVPSHDVYSVNGDDARALLRNAAPDLILVYGTGLVQLETYRIAGRAAINAHGGKIPGYRGLDTNLWAAYKGRPQDMTVTLHEIDESLDTGPVYMERPIGRPDDLSLISLRYHTTLVCTDMFVKLIKDFVDGQPEPRRQDTSESLYYGPMPWLLKRQTDRLLHAWVAEDSTR